MKKALLVVTVAAVLVAALGLSAISAMAAVYQVYGPDDLTLSGTHELRDEPGTFDNKAIWGTDRDDSSTTHTAVLDFTVPADGTYYVWFHVYSTHDEDNSLFLSMNGSTPATFDYKESSADWYHVWYWMWTNSREAIGRGDASIPFREGRDGTLVEYELSAGANQLVIATREAGAKYNRIIITDDKDYDPNEDPKLANNADPLIALAPPPPPTGGVSVTPGATGDVSLMFFVIALAAGVVGMAKFRKE